jgi:hypothetical protein
MNEQNLEILDNSDVIAISEEFRDKFNGGNTLKIQQLLEEYQEYIADSNGSSKSEIFIESIECEVLSKDGNFKGWRKGKIKFVVQFEPEEAEISNNLNSLEDIRRQINSKN